MNILFVAENMNINGANRSLLNLLSAIDTNRHRVDLLLFSHSGPLMNSIPSTVRLLPPDGVLSYFSSDLRTAFKKAPFKIKLIRLLAAILRKFSINAYIAIKELLFYWAPSQKTQYDLAVGYCEGSTHRFVLQKTHAKKKVGWIHIHLEDFSSYKCQQLALCRKLDRIVVVSQASKLSAVRCGVEDSKIRVIHNILPVKQILELSSDKGPAVENDCSVKLLTVGRLVAQKGIDLLLDIAAILKAQQIDFNWHVVGGGVQLLYYREKAKDLSLENHVIFHGSVSNPYPFFASCDVYVQPSFSEGWGMAITEAKILKKPVVASDIPVFGEQITHEKNGLLCSLNAEDFAHAISRIIHDCTLRESVIRQISSEDLGYEKDVNKLYELC